MRRWPRQESNLRTRIRRLLAEVPICREKLALRLAARHVARHSRQRVHRAAPDAGRGAACHDLFVAATVLIVDDHAGFRSFARALLEAEGFDVVGEAADGTSALVLTRALAPELVLLDVALPDMDGFSVCEALLEDGPGPVVVLTSSRDASSYRRRLERSHARGFIPKSELSGPALAALAGG
jgi:CheY-like chemotaxis protein